MHNDARGLRTWVEIDTKALSHNYQLFRGRLDKKTALMGVAKSNAYGHDMTQYAKELERLGVDWIGVDSIVEGITLRKAGITTPILILGYTLPDRFKDAAENGLSVTVSNMDAVQALASVAVPLNIHFKIDTGMHRQGLRPEEVKLALESTASNSSVTLEGVYTHFAAAKNPSLREITDQQVSLFLKVKQEIEDSGLTPLFHAAATGGTLIYPEAHFDMVRVGIGLYGLWPSGPTRAAFEEAIPLKPILSWKTCISEVKVLKEGEGIGYDLTERALTDMKIAVCPIGYWHGYPRAYSSTGPVMVRNKKTRVMGRVSMDMISIDITDIPEVEVGDEVTLLGGEIDADYLAGISETSNYEVVTRINPLIKRVYV